MADGHFPGRLSVDTDHNDLRRRHTSEQASSSGRLTSQDGLLNQHRSHGSVATTPFVLQDFFSAESSRCDDSDIELEKINLDEPQATLQIPRPTPSPGGESMGGNIFQYAHTPHCDHSLEPPQIPDPEIASTSINQSGHYRGAPTGIISWIRDKFRQPVIPLSTETLLHEVEEHFPCRSNLPVQVVDFYSDRAVRFSTTLGKIESVMFYKPDEIDVRWIHAPLGVGLFHSSVEDIFLKGEGQEGSRSRRRPSLLPRGKVFSRAGRAGWPYLETEILNVRSTEHMEKARTTAQAFLDDSKAQEILDGKVFDNNANRYLVNDVKWRAYHLRRKPTYWETIKSDLPLLLSDGAFIMKSPAAMKQQPNLMLKKQTLQEDPAYKHAYLARDSFRCFHRGDNFLLSLSPSTGIDYLNSNLPEITRDPCRYLNSWRSSKEKTDDFEFPNKDLSVIGHVFDQFQDDGTSRWHHKTAEWLMVFLMTEIASTPHSMRSGYSIATILDAYDAQVSKLIERKFEPWAREETAKLFQSYLKTIDELKTLGQIYRKKLGFLKHLFKDCKEIETELSKNKETVSVDESMTMAGRVQFAVSAVGDLVDQCEQLTKELTASLNLMFQLRSIEQNDRSISVDSQSRAILILSGVTMIFLPLSFLASFFSMNVQGLAESPPPTTLGRFWKLCGLITMCLVICIAVFLWRVRSGNHWKTLMTVIGTKAI